MSNKLQKLSRYYIQICIVVVIVSYLLITCLFSYEDTVSYTTWSVNFWDLFFQGRLSEYYAYSQENLRQAPYGCFCGSYITTFPWILWNFPLYLTHPLCKIAKVDSMPCILWSKLLLLICTIGVGIVVYKIVKDIFRQKEEQAWVAVLLSIGGYEIVNSTAYAGQDEIIYVLFFLIALFYLLKGNTKKYLIWSCIAVTVCPIMLIPFIAAYLIYEKNVWKIIGGTIWMLAPSALFEIAYRHDDIYHSYKGINSTEVFTTMLIRGDLVNTALGEVSVVGAALVILFFICYVVKKEEEKKNFFLIYAVSASFFIVCFMAPFNVFYRFGIYVPLWSVLLVLFWDRININVFLLTVVSYGRALCSLGYSPTKGLVLAQNWNAKYLMPEILSGVSDQIRMRATSDMLSNVLGDYYYIVMVLVQTVVFACGLILLATNRKSDANQICINISYRVSSIVYACSSMLFLIAFFICVWGK